ncbi:hypothetical protein [Pseudooceanicola sp. 200-1SW]|uniref:hypothetical protein n=1 Tax=Pseudooceanicola sp. 200-1SW TaxID=3425949 RepID=UPI003D7F9A0E
MLTPDESARLRSDWAARKAARGTPIPTERLSRLTPHHLVGPAPLSAEMAEVLDITECCRGKVRALIARRAAGQGPEDAA